MADEKCSYNFNLMSPHGWTKDDEERLAAAFKKKSPEALLINYSIYPCLCGICQPSDFEMYLCLCISRTAPPVYEYPHALCGLGSSLLAGGGGGCSKNASVLPSPNNSLLDNREWARTISLNLRPGDRSHKLYACLQVANFSWAINGRVTCRRSPDSNTHSVSGLTIHTRSPLPHKALISSL